MKQLSEVEKNHKKIIFISIRKHQRRQAKKRLGKPLFLFLFFDFFLVYIQKVKRVEADEKSLIP